MYQLYPLTNACACQYEGEYKGGVMDGKGTYRFADGSVYVGDYKAGKREGRGVYRFADGAVYEGEYKAGAMEGFGTYQYLDGRAEVGRYAANVDVGEGVRWSSDRGTAWRLMDGRVVEEVRVNFHMQSLVLRICGPKLTPDARGALFIGRYPLMQPTESHENSESLEFTILCLSTAPLGIQST